MNNTENANKNNLATMPIIQIMSDLVKLGKEVEKHKIPTVIDAHSKM